MILPRLLLLAWLYAATSLAVAIVHTSSDPHDEVRTLTARKTAAVFMGFPALRCSTSGVSETVTSDRCVRLRAGTKSLRVEEITSGCKLLAFANENCSGRPNPLLTGRCYDMTSYTALVADC